MGRFGETAAEYEERRAQEGHFIKGFKGDTKTRLRLVGRPPMEWVTFREHYEDDIGYFPCSEEPDCVGCTGQPDRQRSRRYLFTALDEKGNLNIYKASSTLYKQIRAREGHWDSVMDRDLIIIRDGKTKDDTNYTVDGGDKYPVEYTDEIPDLVEVLTSGYERAAKMYGEGAGGKPMAEDRVPEPSKPDAVEQAAAVDDGEPASPFEDMSTPELKKFLDDHKVEYPANAKRPVLVKLAEDVPPF